VAKKGVGNCPKAFRQMAEDRLAQCDNLVELVKALGISRRLLHAWREQRQDCGTHVPGLPRIPVLH